MDSFADLVLFSLRDGDDDAVIYVVRQRLHVLLAQDHLQVHRFSRLEPQAGDPKVQDLKCAIPGAPLAQPLDEASRLISTVAS